jgi:hypothetical protein
VGRRYPPSPEGGTVSIHFEYEDWSPNVDAAARAMYGRLRIGDGRPKWSNLNIDEKDHYRIAASKAVQAFMSSAMRGPMVTEPDDE